MTQQIKNRSKRVLAWIPVLALTFGSLIPQVQAGAEGLKVQLQGQQAINVNKADAGALQVVKGIGPALAQRIIEYREANGPFKAPEDLLSVKGIGKTKLEKIKPYVSF